MTNLTLRALASHAAWQNAVGGIYYKQNNNKHKTN
jgi:hypothetical protein